MTMLRIALGKMAASVMFAALGKEDLAVVFWFGGVFLLGLGIGVKAEESCGRR